MSSVTSRSNSSGSGFAAKTTDMASSTHRLWAPSPSSRRARATRVTMHRRPGASLRSTQAIFVRLLSSSAFSKSGFPALPRRSETGHLFLPQCAIPVHWRRSLTRHAGSCRSSAEEAAGHGRHSEHFMAIAGRWRRWEASPYTPVIQIRHTPAIQSPYTPVILSRRRRISSRTWHGDPSS